MKKLILWLLVLGAVFYCVEAGARSRWERVPSTKNPYREYPDTDVTIPLLNRAQRTVVILHDKISDLAVYDALSRALQRGVLVTVITRPKTHMEYITQYDKLIDEGLDLFLDRSHSAISNNFIVIDNFVVLETVSGHWALYHNATIALVYFNEWTVHYRHSH